jgi:hypothetical protein
LSAAFTVLPFRPVGAWSDRERSLTTTATRTANPNSNNHAHADGNSDPDSEPTPKQITLSAARGYKVQGQQAVDFSWNGATSNNIDICHNGALVPTVPKIPGFYTDHIGVRGKGAYTYKVSEGGTQNSNLAA